MDIKDLIQQQIAEVLRETPGEGGDPIPQPQVPAASPITLNIQGQPVTFRDQADLEAQLNATAIALRQAQAQPVQPVSQPTAAAQGSRVTNDDDSGFSNDEYIRLMNEDPRKATKYVMSHALFNGQVEDPMEVIRESLVNQAATNRKLAAYQFRDSHREVPLEDPRVANTIEGIREQLNLPFTEQGLEAAYAYAIQKNQLPNFRAIAESQRQQQEQPQQYGQYPAQSQYNPYNQPQYSQTPQNPYLQAPPAPGRSSPINSPVSEDQIENMSTEQLASLLNKLSNAGVRG